MLASYKSDGIVPTGTEFTATRAPEAFRQRLIEQHVDKDERLCNRERSETFFKSAAGSI